MEAKYLTSADVSRRLGVEGGTVRYYAETLRELGFPMPKEEETGAYLWSPELLEVARAAYAMAKATKGLSFKEAVELILYAGEAAYHAQAGRSILTLLHRALALPQDLEDALEEVRQAAEDLRSLSSDLRREVREVATGLRGELSRAAAEVRSVVEEARAVVREAQGGGWVGPVALLLVALGLFTPALGLPLPTALVAALGLLGAGVFLGWWVRG